MEEIANIIMRRDHISYNEALHAVELCKEELLEAIDEGQPYEEVIEILAWWLGLEPDYLEVLLP